MTTRDRVAEEKGRSPRAATWRGRRVLVTGHTGFKGAWLCLFLRQLGAEVAGYALEPPSVPSLWDLADVAEGMTSVHGDVRDFDGIYGRIRTFEPEVVFHLAAQSLVRPSYEDPIETYSTNVMGTVHVLEAIRWTKSVRAAVMVTSDKCYENREWVWPYRENEAMGGYDPYSSTKGCAEIVTAAYRRSFFAAEKDGAAAVASARAGNVIGGGDWAKDRLIPDLVRGLVDADPIHIRSPKAIRPWQHVLDALAGYLLLAESLLGEDGARFAEGWNFGPAPSDVRPVEWIVERLVERWREAVGEVIEPTLDPGPHPHEATFLELDSSKARKLLDWRPRLDLGEALDWIVEWTRVHRLGGDVRQVCEEQIERYRARG